MKSALLLRAALAIMIAGAVIFAGYIFIQVHRTMVMLTFGVLFATLCYFVVIFRGRARDIALASATLVLGLGIIEIAVSIMGGFPTTSRENGVWGRKGDLGWSPMSPGAIHEKKVAANGEVIYDVVNTIDEHLNRKVVSAESGPTIAFFGDSFTYGQGLNDADTFPQAFADLTDRKFRVLNLAVVGYGPQQFLRALEEDFHDALLKTDPRLFIMLTAPWHAQRVSCKASNAWYGPRYVLMGGAPVYQGTCAEQTHGVVRLMRELFRSTEMFQYFVDARERPLESSDLDLYVAILVKAGEIAHQKYGVPTLILFLPDNLSDNRYRLEAGYTNEYLMRKMREGGLRVLDASFDVTPYNGQNLFIPDDGHPTGLTNRIWARMAKEVVTKQFSLGE